MMSVSRSSNSLFEKEAIRRRYSNTYLMMWIGVTNCLGNSLFVQEIVLFRDPHRKKCLFFKCPYGVHLKHLRILKECDKLVKSLRMRLGNAFLQGAHIVCVHPVTTNLFVKTNRYNHLPTNTW